jgi:hypothetical protein
MSIAPYTKDLLIADRAIVAQRVDRGFRPCLKIRARIEELEEQRRLRREGLLDDDFDLEEIAAVNSPEKSD